MHQKKSQTECGMHNNQRWPDKIPETPTRQTPTRNDSSPKHSYKIFDKGRYNMQNFKRPTAFLLALLLTLQTIVPNFAFATDAHTETLPQTQTEFVNPQTNETIPAEDLTQETITEIITDTETTEAETEAPATEETKLLAFGAEPVSFTTPEEFYETLTVLKTIGEDTTPFTYEEALAAGITVDAKNYADRVVLTATQDGFETATQTYLKEQPELPEKKHNKTKATQALQKPC